MATPTRDQIIARYKETRGLDDAAAGALADAYLASKGATPTAKPAPAPKPSPVAKKSEPVAEKKASPPATRTASAPAPAAKKPEPVAETKVMDVGVTGISRPAVLTDDNPGYRGVKPSSSLGIVDAAKRAYKVATTPLDTPWSPKAAMVGPVAPPSTMDEKGNTRVLGAKPTIQNFTPPPPPPPPAPGRAPAGMTMSSFSGGVPSTPEVAARLAPAMATDEVKAIRTAMKKQKPEMSAQIDQLSDEQVLARKDRVAAQ